LKPIGPRTGETLTKEYSSLNPKQKIPFMQHGDLSLSESVAICRYLQNTFPSKNLFIPGTNSELAKEDEWCSYIYGEVDETSLYVMRRHYDLKEIYGEAPDVVLSCREYLKRHFKVIEKHLEKNETLLSDGFGLADILLMSCLDWAIFYEFDLSKNITIYRENISKREAYKKAMEVNYGG
jgi:glutathione S-transferase